MLYEQRSSGRRQRPDDSFYSDAASETSSVCSETSFRTGSEVSDVCDVCLFIIMLIIVYHISYHVISIFAVAPVNHASESAYSI